MLISCVILFPAFLFVFNMLQTYPQSTGLTTVTVPLALATRKAGLTAVESAVKAFFKVVDIFGSLIGLPKTTKLIDSRIGSLLLTSHSTTVPKVAVLSGKKLTNTQVTTLGAAALWDKYHYTESFEAGADTKQAKIIEGHRVIMCLEDLKKVLQSKYVNTADGKRAEILRLEYNAEQEAAVIDYKVQYTYTTNLKVTKL